MPTHILRLIIALTVFLSAALAAKVYFTDDSFYRFGHYRADAVPMLASGDPRFRGPDSCSQCHVERHTEWSTGAHGHVKCEVCHGPAQEHPATGKLPIPDDTIELCTLCHLSMPARPAAQPQIVVGEHPYPHDEPLQCITCHNPHSPRLGDASPGADKLVSQCSGCHGEDGKGVGAFPALAGRDAAYLGEQLRRYRSGRRQNPMMTPVAKGLTDDDIQRLSDYYAGQAAQSVEPGAGPSVMAPRGTTQLTTRCVGCHGPDGEGVGSFPALAGKEAAYIGHQLMQYRSGERQNPMMTPIARQLSDDEIDRLARFYGSKMQP